MNNDVKKWALILGASSGFGGASAVELAKNGYNIFGVHLDRQATMQNVEDIKKQIVESGSKAVFFNINAADQNKRTETLDEIKRILNEENSKVKVIIHSLAFGALKPFFAKNEKDALNQSQIEMTLDVMANALVYWTQGLVFRDILSEGGRIFALTSAGSQTVIPNYGAVSAAKAAIESYIRQIAVELGFMGVTANSIMAGVTDTPALKKIPGNDKMIDAALTKNPAGRLTTPQDVAKAIVLLSNEYAYFVSGNVINVDGGEYIVNYVGEKICKGL